MIYFHTTKFGFNWPSNNTDKEGDGIQPPYQLGLKFEQDRNAEIT